MSNDIHLDAQAGAKVSAAIERGDVAWFSHTPLSQHELNYSLLYCAYRQPSVELVEGIIQAGAHNLAQVCAHALSYENYSLAHCLMQYWHTHRASKPDVNINVPASYYDKDAKRQRPKVQFDLFRHVVPDLFMIVDQGRNIELFEMIVQSLPNHTQKIRQCDKFYDEIDIWTYEKVYNKTLRNALSALWQTKQKDKLADYQRAILALTTKQFPLTQNNIRLVNAAKLTHLFENRLNRQFNNRNNGNDNAGSNANGYGKIDTLASQKFLQSPGSTDTISKRVELYYEIADYFVIPDSVTDYIIDALHEKKQNQRAPRLPEMEESAFFDKLYQSESDNHQKLFWFFNKYYALDKLLFYKNMKKQFIDSEDADYQQYEEQKSVRKIKI